MAVVPGHSRRAIILHTVRSLYPGAIGGSNPDLIDPEDGCRLINEGVVWAHLWVSPIFPLRNGRGISAIRSSGLRSAWIVFSIFDAGSRRRY